jgi:hypothetical protein
MSKKNFDRKAFKQGRILLISLVVCMALKEILRKKDWRAKRTSMIINGEVSNFTKTFRNNFTTLLISALGLVAALQWNDAIKGVVTTLFPGKSTVIYNFYIAITITIISVTLTYFLSKFKSE